jgi:ribonuclease HI
MDLTKVKAIYTDGGLVQKNPSPIGGSWAFRFVDSEDRLGGNVVHQFSGGRIQPGITNNTVEFIAAVLAFRALPEGWSGVWSPDSEVTVTRLLYGGQGRGLSQAQIDWGKRAMERIDVKNIKVVMLGGHPTNFDLTQGFRKKDNKLVSIHNVWADKACGIVNGKLLNVWNSTMNEAEKLRVRI